MKVVLDTNVFLSGLAYPKGTPGRIVAAWDAHSFDIVMSEYQLGEIARVLAYPKLRKLLGWSNDEIQQFVEQTYLRTILVDLEGVEVDAPKDGSDRPILAALVAANASVLITGDKGLLALRDRYAIETPAEFVRRL